MKMYLLKFEKEIGANQQEMVETDKVLSDFWADAVKIPSEVAPHFVIDAVSTIGKGTMAGSHPVAYVGDSIRFIVTNITAQPRRFVGVVTGWDAP